MVHLSKQNGLNDGDYFFFPEHSWTNHHFSASVNGGQGTVLSFDRHGGDKQVQTIASRLRRLRTPLWATCLAALMASALPWKADALEERAEDVAPTAVPSAPQGTWSAVIPGKAVAIHIALLPSGNLALWQDAGEPGNPQPEPAKTLAFMVTMTPGRLPSLSDWAAIPNPSVNLFCAGQAHLPDGNIFVVGGQAGKYYYGVDIGTVLNYKTGAWNFLPTKMENPRWYPSVTPLPNGEMLVLSGTMNGQGDGNKIPEIWNTGTQTWRELTGAQAKLYTYPWLSINPKDGRVFMAGPYNTKYLSTIGAGKFQNGPERKFLLRSAGSFAVYGPGKIIAIGGGDAATYHTAETIDLLAATPAWKQTGTMASGRRYGTAVTLPDGMVLMSGGGEDQVGPSGVLAPELWNPATGAWTKMAPMKEARLYHSIALVLPDARVLIAGGGRKSRAIDHNNFEFFSPPYLSNGTRPTITSIPAQVTYGQTFTVATPNAAGIQKVSIMRLGAITHEVNAGQVFYPASFTKGSGLLNVTAPPNANYAPPGYYMLFILNGSGVPSVAKIFQIT